MDLKKKFLQDCPNFFPDVRTQQCSKYNGKLYKGRVFAWEPFLDGRFLIRMNISEMKI